MRGSGKAKAQVISESAITAPDDWLSFYSNMLRFDYDRLAYLSKSIALFAVYFITANIGLSIDAVSGFATVVWPPTGIALAAMLILGFRYWPAVALAAFAVNISTGAPLMVAAGMGAGNTLEALTGAYLLKNVAKFQPSLERVRDVLALVILAGLVSTVISATIGTASLYMGGIVTSGTFVGTWVAWWVGDILGALIVAPLFLVWNGHVRYMLHEWRYLKAFGLMVLLALASVLIFKGSFWTGAEPFTFTYLIFPFFIWLALRFGQRGNVSAMFVVSLVAIWITVVDFGSIPGHRLSQSLFLLQILMGVTAVTFMVMAAVVTERERTLKHQQRLKTKAEILNKQRKRLMAINQAKDEFIGLASHQLRTPATGVKQYVGMLLDNYVGVLTKDQRELLSRAYDCNERQIHIINELLAIAQIDAGNVLLNREKVNVTEIIKGVLTEQVIKFENRNQKVSFITGKRDILAVTDKARFRMVIENLIDNASKYSRDGKDIVIHASKSKGVVTVSVEDNGIGMAKKDLSRLFKKFSRIDNPLSTEVGGTGLGLYLAKKIVVLHGGTITASSKLNEGSVFTINLPAT